MPYDLFITSIQGETHKSLRSPYPTREDTRRTVRICVSGVGSLPNPSPEFVDAVLSAPLGQTVRHEESGVAFRTEEPQP